MIRRAWLTCTAFSLLACGPGGSSLPVAKAVKVVGGNSFACALTAEGSVRCWGWGGEADGSSYGWMGAASAYRVTAPVDVGGFTGALDLASDYQHICVLTAQKTVKCWGQNDDGQLGLGNYKDTNGPTGDVQGLSGAKKVVVGGDHSCALLENGKVMCWGDTSAGQLGRAPMGSNVNSAVAEEVPFITGATDLHAMGYGTCAIVGGEALCWGDGRYPNNLNFGTSPPYKLPLPNVSAAIIGRHNGYAISNGGLKSWGSASEKLLGNNTDFGDPEAESPVDVTGMTSGVTALAFACGVQAGAVKCWGFGNTGDGTTDIPKVPVTAVGISDAIGFAHAGEGSCAVGARGTVWCWGNNLHGVIGIGVDAERSEVDDYPTPQKVLGFTP